MTRLLGLAALAAFVSDALAHHVLHEKRSAPPAQWQRSSDLDMDSVIPVKIGLLQSNMHLAEKYLYEVAHPSSKKFGQHWTPKRITETFKPHGDSIAVVKNWLLDSGFTEQRIALSRSSSWVQVNATIAEAQQLLKTEYFLYQHSVTGQPQIACHEYHLPNTVAPHVDFITPTVHFDAPIHPKHRRRAAGLAKVHKSTVRRRRDTRTVEEAQRYQEENADQPIPIRQPGIGQQIGTSLGSLPKPGATLAEDGGIQNLESCDRQITPACLRALYGFEEMKESHEKNSLGIVEYSPQSYVQEDLEKFFANFSKQSMGKQPKLQSIDSGVLLPTNRSFDVNAESNLDLEIAMAIAAPLQVTLYQVGDAVQGASFNNFVDAIDGDYCEFNGGDDKEEDAVYPAPPDGYIGPPTCGLFTSTKVLSTSYGYNEADLTPAYVKRQCAEYLKLALQGVTVLYSSGDYGVAGNVGRCIDAEAGNYTRTNATEGMFNPSFPSGCPWVTSVGATEVARGVNIVDVMKNDGKNDGQPEKACETVIRSGGGFSNVFDMPEYQQTVVKRWFSEHPPAYGADRFNNSQRTRGFPDIAVNGANYVVTVNGNFSLIYGTSASAPALAGMIALINDERLKQGKNTVGFINPTLYEHPDVLKDVTEGKNPGCGTPGFAASEGWDPATGLGTPIFPRMKELFMRLP